MSIDFIFVSTQENFYFDVSHSVLLLIFETFSTIRANSFCVCDFKTFSAHNLCAIDKQQQKPFLQQSCRISQALKYIAKKTEIMNVDTQTLLYLLLIDMILNC